MAAATDLALGLVGRGLIGLGTWLDRTEPVFQHPSSGGMAGHDEWITSGTRLVWELRPRFDGPGDDERKKWTEVPKR